MGKPEFVFYWADSPQSFDGETRSNMARLFRAYRRKGSGLRLRKDGPGRYMVARIHDGPFWPNSADAVGVFQRRG